MQVLSFESYYWTSFVLTFIWGLNIPSQNGRKMSKLDNTVGSFMCALFGFAFWPFFFIAYVKTRKKAK